MTLANQIKTAQDLYSLAKKQLIAEGKALKNCQSSWLFCDTDLHNIVIWSQHVFNSIDPRLQKMEEEQHYDLYLLLSPDLPWIADGLRQNPHLREQLYQVYRARLIEKNRPFVEISGKRTRFQACLKALGHFKTFIAN